MGIMLDPEKGIYTLDEVKDLLDEAKVTYVFDGESDDEKEETKSDDEASGD